MTETEEQNIEVFTCQYCNQTFSNKHGRSIHKAQWCKRNPKNVVNEYLEKKEQELCQYCQEPFHYKEVKRHEGTCRENPGHKVKKRKNPLKLTGIQDYDTLNKDLKKCQFCKQLFKNNGVKKHEAYCSENPNGKSKYSNEKKWKCTFCNSLFTSETALKTHRPRCEKNPNIKEVYLDNFERLRDFKVEFPEIYNMLTPGQIKEFLDGEL